MYVILSFSLTPCVQSLEHWKGFFANHKKYVKVGKVMHPSIDPASPIPEPCREEKSSEDKDNKKASKKEDTSKKHQEL